MALAKLERKPNFPYDPMPGGHGLRGTALAFDQRQGGKTGSRAFLGN